MVNSKFGKGFFSFLLLVVFLFVGQLRASGIQIKESVADHIPTIVDVGSLMELQNAIHNTLPEESTVINITTDIELLGTIVIDEGKDITLQSSSPEVRTLTQLWNSRHFEITGANSSLTMEDGVILDGGGRTGGVFISAPTASFIMNGGTICHNVRSDAAGAVSSNGIFIMNGGTIRNNSGSSAGGVYTSGTFIMNGGTIENNNGHSAGGVYVHTLTRTNLVIASEATFIGNEAAWHHRPPFNVEQVFPNIESRSSSIFDYSHPLNKFDIGFETTLPFIRTLSLDAVGGEISVAGEIHLNNREVFEGTVVSLEAIPAPGYQFTGWTSSNGGTFADAVNPNTTFTMPSHNTTITANFDLAPEKEKITFSDFFPDENLAQAVANRFSRQITDEVTEEELQQLTGIISGMYQNISDLEGVQYLTSISHLYLDGNKLTNESLQPLTQLPNLMMLFLNENQITDLSVFSNSKNQYLTISAMRQSIILDPINQGDVIEGIFIRSRYGQVPVIYFNSIEDSYQIEIGRIIWAGVGENTLTWNDNNNFSGTITQVVNSKNN